MTLLITDRNLALVGDPISTWTDLDIAGQFNQPASGSFTVPAEPSIMAQLNGGNRVVVVRNGSVFTSGPIEKPGPYSWEVGGGEGKVTVHFADDLALIVGHVAYPDPTQVATAQTTVAHWTMTGTAENVLRALVDANAGPGALASRRVPQLVLGPAAGVGSTITLTLRYDPLGDAMRAAATAGGGLGFRTVQVGNQIQFQVYEPADRSLNVRFSQALGNLRSVSYDPDAPTATVAIVAGQGEGTARQIREIVDSAAVSKWWRLETFVDQRQTNVVAELDAAGASTLTGTGEQVKLTTVTVDTPSQQYGRDYQLGDVVTVELWPGTQFTDVVRGFHLQATPKDGELMTAIIGSQEATRDPRWMSLGHELYRRVGRLERI